MIEKGIISSSRNIVRKIKVKKETAMKKMHKKTAPRECSTSRCSSVHDEKQAAKKTQIFIWPAEVETGEVCLAGDFNNWNPEPMTRTADEFRAVMDLVPGEYQYKFIVDGQWVPDLKAAGFEPNAFGSVNSVVIV